MTALQSAESREQNTLVASFVKNWAALGQVTMEAAEAYRACIANNIDMTRWVKSRAVHDKLLMIAAGKLAAMSQTELLCLPTSMAAILATLSDSDQKRVLREGLLIKRGNKIVAADLTGMSRQEMARAIDITGGSGRILSIAEQEARAEPRPTPHDQIVGVRLDFGEARDLFAAAHKRGRSPHTLIKDVLKEAGII